MKTSRRQAAVACCGLATMAVVPLQVRADTYPSRPVEFMVPYPAGGLVDVAARILGERFREALGQPVVVVNRPGASSMIGTNAVVRAKPDGYSLLITTSTLTMNVALTPKQVSFDVLSDLAPIAIVATTSQILVVPATQPVRSVRELIELAKARPGKLTFGSGSTGTPSHLAGEQLRSLAGVDILHVPYNGAPPAMNALLAGETSMLFSNLAVAMPQVRAGRIRALAVASPTRSALAPDVPTMAEAGMPMDADQWIGFMAPRGTPTALIQRIAAVLNTALASEDVRAALAKSGIVAEPSSTPASFASVLRQDIDRYRKIVRDAKIRLE
ncbi:MAG: Bug family tripartite tricarboxylate transporter substrate binding protein [bacterium]|nr:tripartite tricarboxylate transporter substrate binding protein [Betaproteobacteria bacterium]